MYRRRLLTDIMLTRPALDVLEKSNQLKPMVNEVLEETNITASRRNLGRWLGRSECVDTLVDQGFFDALYKAPQAARTAILESLSLTSADVPFALAAT